MVRNTLAVLAAGCVSVAALAVLAGGVERQADRAAAQPSRSMPQAAPSRSSPSQAPSAAPRTERHEPPRGQPQPLREAQQTPGSARERAAVKAGQARQAPETLHSAARPTPGQRAPEECSAHTPCWERQQAELQARYDERQRQELRAGRCPAHACARCGPADLCTNATGCHCVSANAPRPLDVSSR